MAKEPPRRVLGPEDLASTFEAWAAEEKAAWSRDSDELDKLDAAFSKAVEPSLALAAKNPELLQAIRTLDELAKARSARRRSDLEE